MPDFPLPPELEPLRDRLAPTTRPAAYFSVADDAPASRTESFVGGVPYWPAGLPWPVAATPGGAPLHFLAQVDLADVPALPGVPRSGLLQVFLADDDLYGCPMGPGHDPTRQSTWRLVTHADVDAPTADPPAGLGTPEYSPLSRPDRPRRLRFEPEARAEPINNLNDAFDTVVGDSEELAEQLAGGPGDRADAVVQLMSRWGAPLVGAHKMGGWANFDQGDPAAARGGARVLLLQLDSDVPRHDAFLWGDMGSAQFLIEPDALARWDLGRVLYDWACG